jgi:hypothetical protein
MDNGINVDIAVGFDDGNLLVQMLDKQLEWMTEYMLALQLDLMMKNLLVTMLDKRWNG